MKAIALVFCLFICITAGSNLALAQEQQETEQVYKVITYDGNEFVGQILFQDEEYILLRTEKFGELRIQRKDIRLLELIQEDGKTGGQGLPENLQATRYFWAPNGYGLRAGEGYYQNLWVLFNQASIGITDNISMGLGLMPLFLFNGTSSPVWITPKISVPVIADKFNLGGGALMGTVIGEKDAGFGIIYGVSTLGSRDRNVTIGLGYGYAAGSWANTPLFNFSGTWRLGKNSYFLTENYFISVEDETISLFSAGGRLMLKRVGLDFGLFLPVATGENFFIALPWLGFSVPFGKKR